MKKIISIFLCILAIPCVYLAYDYARFILKPRSDKKKILIVSEHINPDSFRASVIDTIEQCIHSKNKLSSSVADVSTLGFSFFNAEDAPAQKPLSEPAVQRWSSLVADCDGIIFVVPNYNDGYPAGIKNAIDMLWKEWHNKPIAVVAYSMVHEDSSTMIGSFIRVLNKIKSDPVSPLVYITPDEVKKCNDDHDTTMLQSRIDDVVVSLHRATFDRHYLKHLYRSITDKMLRAVIRFFKKKHEKTA